MIPSPPPPSGPSDHEPEIETILADEVRTPLSSRDAAAGGAPLSPEIERELARLKPEEAGERIGPYKLLQQIGEGGFGVVWMAEQEKPVRRRVALKIIKMGMDTREIVARFEQERQALAMMDHPNIAKVFDAGATQHGRPFFVMELVRGIRITDYCDQANLPTVERLQLFIAVCHAIQHAHQKGIIHRDLKPSNILVTLHDGLPVPKVIDFGVAKATEQRLTDLTVFTQFEQMIGTPLYMSPEQAEMSGLDIDTRSDIYSLGVLLYELLAGRTPFDPAELMKHGLDEVRRVIREEEPPRPSAALGSMAAEVRTTIAQHRQSDSTRLLGELRGDLDWIVMKALEKDRTRRYDTANAFAEDIQRHLASEPVVASPPSRLYRVRKLVRRNRLAVGAATAITVLLLAGIAVSMWQAVRATRAEMLAKARLEEANRQTLRAMEAEALAKTRLEEATRQTARATQAEALATERLKLVTAEKKRADDEKASALAAKEEAERQKKSAVAASEREQAVLSIFNLPTKGDASRKEWEITKVNGRDYLSMKNVAEFYGLNYASHDGSDPVLTSNGRSLKGAINSEELFINSLKFILSYPLVEQDGETLMSRMDLTKTVEPVMRPSRIKGGVSVDTIVLNPARGGEEDGAKSKYGLEKNYTLDVANRARVLLVKAGFKVLMTRIDDSTVSVPDRLRLANEQSNALLISIHFQSSEPTSTGIETYALAPQGVPSMSKGSRISDLDKCAGNINDAPNMALATAVHAAAILRAKMYDRGIKRDRFDVIRDATIPAVMLMGGFLSHSYDAKLVATPDYRQQLAASIVQAAQNYRRAVGTPSKGGAAARTSTPQPTPVTPP